MTRHLASAVALSALLLSGCAKKKAWVAKPAEGAGVRIEMSSHEYDKKKGNLLLRVVNNTQDSVVLSRKDVAVVLPDGSEVHQHEDGKPYFTLMAGLSRYMRFEFESPDVDLREVEGLWLRFDGIFIGEYRLAVPAMAIDAPEHGVGVARQPPVPDLALAEYEKGRAARGNLQVASVSTSAPAPAAVPKKTSTSGFSGERKTIRERNTKVAAMPFKASNVSKTVSFIIDEILLTELQTVGFEAIGPEDINALVGFEQMRDELDCDEAACAAEIGNALGVSFLASGNIANIDGTTVITLKLINVKETKVVARVNKLAEGGPRILPRIIAEAVQEMVERSGL